MPDSARPAPLTRRTLLASAGLAAAAAGGLSACGGGGSGSGSGSASTTPVTVRTSEIPVGGGTIYSDAGAVVTQPSAGTFKAFSNICTHAGCPLADVTTTINCNCHGSEFSIADGSVVKGPAKTALPARTVTVQGDSVSVA